MCRQHKREDEKGGAEKGEKRRMRGMSGHQLILFKPKLQATRHPTTDRELQRT